MIVRPNRLKGRKNVTLRDVAERAGVSPKTVSNVINRWPYITDETRQKVLDAIEALGYRPSTLARSLVTGRTKTIGVVIPDLTNPFFGYTVRGAEDALYAAGYNIFLCNTNEEADKERDYLDMLIGRGVDGILMFGARVNSRTLTDVVRGVVPVVAEDAPAQHANTSVIDIDNCGGARLATQHLLDRGHTRIGHLAGPAERLAAQGRLAGYRATLADAGIACDPALIVQGEPTIRGGYLAAMELLGRQRPPALFCYNDLMALGAMIACRQLHIAIPRDLALVGFDDIDMASLVRPALTTVRVRQYDLGRLAADLLLQHLAGDASPPEHVSFPVELMVRNSCGARRVSTKQMHEMLVGLATTAQDGRPLQSLGLPVAAGSQA